MINYEQEVKKVYPDAKRSLYYSPDSGSWFIIHAGKIEISFARPDGINVWEKAYKTLKKQ